MSQPPGTAPAGARPALPRSVRRAMLLRSFAVQGSWNYTTLIGTGLVFVLAPALRHLYGDDPARLRAAVARHTELFNAHPYLATVAAGAVARLEADGVPPETIGRFKAAVRGSLGSIGDRLVWLMWRPACALLMVALLLAGAGWWISVIAFLVSYNGLHLWMRSWGLEVGLRDGVQVGRALREAPFEKLGERAADVGAVLSGFAAVLALGWGEVRIGWAYAAVGAAALVAGIALGPRVRWVAALGLTALLVAGVVLATDS
ncbi:PTS system mannose/fructose/sorbose family transporter subunit IID [Longimicrobium sp.]|uniref:PTS system mannose/fructose/sorbose family transporter subunit IID n=1 Tax=Longimicrobium sp. TaxID=2029185 RepID=UPI002E2EF423|nr:PTS system mannose/fructose/sorbose family transporter subunit IID [Longimicrobium sp.]HEX6042586.1 PTS system mannose/fructose/sorbose family transporter subunit IID [Longimicrobium sp.]